MINDYSDDNHFIWLTQDWWTCAPLTVFPSCAILLHRDFTLTHAKSG